MSSLLLLLLILGISSPLLLLLILQESDLPPLLIADSRPHCHCHLPLSPTIISLVCSVFAENLSCCWREKVIRQKFILGLIWWEQVLENECGFEFVLGLTWGEQVLFLKSFAECGFEFILCLTWWFSLFCSFSHLMVLHRAAKHTTKTKATPYHTHFTFYF